jgi:nucleoside-diphosphate-sugar epimerase
MDRIVITGSKGFIGTAIRGALKGVLPYKAVTERCEDMRGYTGTLIHLASSISERESFISPTKYIDNNIKNLALLMTNNNFSEIIFPSSASVYDKDGKLEPGSVYGITKLACEMLIKIYFKKYWILRITNPIGPEDKKTVFARLAHCKIYNEVFTIYNGEEAVRDFFPVEHVAGTVMNILNGLFLPGTYNVGSGKKSTIASILKLICERHGIRHTVVDSPGGVTPGYVPTDHLIICDEINVEEEWLKYLS